MFDRSRRQFWETKTPVAPFGRAGGKLGRSLEVDGRKVAQYSAKAGAVPWSRFIVPRSYNVYCTMMLKADSIIDEVQEKVNTR
jgi:hypothetical protein